MTKVRNIIVEIIREIGFLIWTILRDRHEKNKKKKISPTVQWGFFYRRMSDA